ncbi:MAG: hypothetical protein LAQ30_26010 [Acidobacteriia bacterium]|nr:hypothetical protein [Terriglobia bacterium]
MSIFTGFSSYARAFNHQTPLPRLPFRAHLNEHTANIPDGVLDAVGYRDFLDAVLRHGETAMAEFDALLERADGPT